MSLSDELASWIRDNEIPMSDRLGRIVDALAALEGSQDARDAARYRWLRDYGNSIYRDIWNDDEAPLLAVSAAAVRLDSAIDSALAKAVPVMPKEEW